MAKSAKAKQEDVQEVVTTPLVEAISESEIVVEETTGQADHAVEVTPEPELTPETVEAEPEQKEIKESDEIGFLYTIMETMESGGWGKALHPMIKSRIEYLRTK